MSDQIKFWDKTFKERNPTLYPHDSVVSFIFRNIPNNKPKNKVNVLDIGCGGGNNLFFVAEIGLNAYGIDGSENAIAIANKRFKDKKLPAHLFTGDFRELPYESNFFDLVIDRHSICCTDKIGIKKTINEVKRVLIPGGIFFSLFYSDDHTSSLNGLKTKNGMTKGIDKGSLQGFGDLSFFSQNEIENLFSKGFEINSLKYKVSKNVYENLIHSEYEIQVQKNIDR